MVLGWRLCSGDHERDEDDGDEDEDEEKAGVEDDTDGGEWRVRCHQINLSKQIQSSWKLTHAPTKATRLGALLQSSCQKGTKVKL